jgi:hypothetical protein
VLLLLQVGNYPGRALSFSDSPGAPEPQLLSLPSKRVALYAPQGGTLIARSDTNGEDLEAFAGAGLYDRCVFFVIGQLVSQPQWCELLGFGAFGIEDLETFAGAGVYDRCVL